MILPRELLAVNYNQIMISYIESHKLRTTESCRDMKYCTQF